MRPRSRPWPVLALCGLAASALALCVSATPARAEALIVENLTGLPAYPHLSRAAMDPVAKTDTLGRWCTRFAAETPYPLDVVQAWYRKALPGASETDLANDETYRRHASLVGVKFALGVNYVTVFRADDRPITSVELFRCSP